ncbi:hypothetical protein Hypma_000064 [Hypsizygus marmoreus]|uniref:Uncharacterized protein n=1 Tax=Hypsizygus marmoreus TaxID=39966 RepID=A0A369KEL8_HYPMA|nr:hypothetical protein Hypma_000064 [Hypsizygus marmoreus]
MFRALYLREAEGGVQAQASQEDKRGRLLIGGKLVYAAGRTRKPQFHSRRRLGQKKAKATFVWVNRNAVKDNKRVPMIRKNRRKNRRESLKRQKGAACVGGGNPKR